MHQCPISSKRATENSPLSYRPLAFHSSCLLLEAGV